MTTAWWLLVAWIALDVGFLLGCAWVASHQVSRKNHRNVLKLLWESQQREECAELMISQLTEHLNMSTSRLEAATRLLGGVIRPKDSSHIRWD